MAPATIFDADGSVVRDHTKGIPFFELTPGEADQVKVITQSPLSDDLPTNNRKWSAWLALTDKFPRSPSSDQWLAPGTLIEAVCQETNSKGACTEVFDRNTNKANKWFILITVKSGLHYGSYALIDEANYDPNFRVTCPPQNPDLKC